MKVLVACEFSGIVRDAFLERGHDAWSCDLLPSENGSNRHIRGDARKLLNDGWDMLLVAHPPCTRLCNSGVRWLSEPPKGKTLANMWLDQENGEWFARTRAAQTQLWGRDTFADIESLALNVDRVGGYCGASYWGYRVNL